MVRAGTRCRATNDAISLRGDVERSDGHPTPICANTAIVDEYPDRSNGITLLPAVEVETGDFRYGASQILSLQRPCGLATNDEWTVTLDFYGPISRAKWSLILTVRIPAARNYDVSFQLSDGDP